MTKEIAEKIVRGITDKIECNTADIDDWAEFWGFTREEYEEFLDMAKKTLEQESNTWNLDDAREDFMSDLYNTLELTNNEANRIIDSFDRVISGIKKEPILNKIKAEIEKQEKWLLQAGYNAYNVDIAFSSIKLVLAESEET